MIALVPPAFFRAGSGIEGSGLDSLVSSDVVTASRRSPTPSSSTACSVCSRLARGRQRHAEAAVLQQAHQVGGAGQRQHLGAQRLVLLLPALAQLVADAAAPPRRRRPRPPACRRPCRWRGGPPTAARRRGGCGRPAPRPGRGGRWCRRGCRRRRAGPVS